MLKLNANQDIDKNVVSLEKMKKNAFTVGCYLGAVILWMTFPYVFRGLRAWQKSAYTIQGTDVETHNTGKSIEALFGGPEKMEGFFINGWSVGILIVLFVILAWISIKIARINGDDNKA